MEDRMLYDGDQQRYLQLLANGGEEEVGIDASDVDSSDVASSNDIDSSDDDDSDADVEGKGGVKNARNKLISSVARAAGRGKRGRAEIGQSATEEKDEEDRSNPLMAEIGSKSERRQAAAQRWFNDPLFEGVEETLAEDNDGGGAGHDEDGEAGDDEERDAPTKRSRRGGDKGSRGGNKELGAAEALMAAMPKTEKERRKEKRKKVRQEPRILSVFVPNASQTAVC